MPEREGTAVLLARLDVFSGLSEPELEQLAAVAVPRSYAAGEVVFREGDAGTACHVVRSGSFKATKAHGDGRTIALAELRPGTMFGELALFSGERRSATIEALEDATTVALLQEDIRRLLLGQPAIAIKMLAALTDRVRAANQRIASQSFQGVAGRVASVLLSQVESRWAEQSQGNGGEVSPDVKPPAGETGGPGEPGEVVVTATQADIAELAGSARESASRFLAVLEREGVVTLRRGRVIVHRPEALHNYIY